MKKLGAVVVYWGATLLVAAGCSGESTDGRNGGFSGSASGAPTSGGGGATTHEGGATTHEGGATTHEGGAGGSDAGECPVPTFEVKWMNLHDTPCANEGLVCHQGSDECGPGTLVASSQTLTCRNGKWYWPGYSERWCCPDLAKLPDAEGDACRDEGHVCYGPEQECEARDVLTCTAGVWQLDSQIPDACGGAGGAGG